MAKGKGSDEGLGHADSGVYTVFMDSNLDTHLAMIVSAKDTVRDLKEKLMIEHPRYFPNIGEIIVNALKVKRKGCFYYLSDSMLVTSIFNGFMKTWFLQFDASRQGEHKENQYHLDPKASELPSHVFTVDGPLPETNTPLLDRPSKDVSIFADSERLYKDGPLPSSGKKKKTREKKKKNKPSNLYDQVDNAIPSGNNVREETSEVALGNNHGDLEGEIDAALAPEQTTAADPFVGLDMCGISKVERGDTSDHVEASRGGKSKRSKKHQTASVEGLNLPMVAEANDLTKDSTTLMYDNSHVGDDTRGETSELAFGSSHGNLGGELDAALASGKTVGADPFVDVGMRKSSTSNLERRDTSNHIEASRGRKSKGSKKHQATNVKGLALPMIAEAGNLTKDSTALVYENVRCDNNVGDDTRGDTSEVALGNNHENLGGEFDAALAPEKTDAADPFVGIDMYKTGTSKVERRDTSDHIEASGGRKSKKSKKHQATNVKGLDLPMIAEAGNRTKDSTTLVYENVRCDNNVGDDTRAETSEVAFGNNHGNFGGEFDAALAPEKTDAAVPFVDGSMLKSSISHVERKDTSNHIEASRGRKSNGSKKYQATSVKELDLPMIAEAGNLTKDSTTLVYENVRCDNNVGDDTRGETSEVAFGNSHGNLGGEFDAAFVPEKTDAADPFVGIDMYKTGTSKVERRDTSDHIEASGGRKSKKSKKQQAASVEGLKIPMVVEPGNLIKESTVLVHETFICDNNDNNNGGDDGTGKTEKEKKSLLQDVNPKPTLSAAPNCKLKSLGLDKTEMNSKSGIISSKLLQSSDISEAGDSGNKRRKKSKKSKDSDQKWQTSSSGIENANGVGGAIPLKSELDKASVSGHCDDETNEKHDTLFRNEELKVSKAKAVNAPVTGLEKADNICMNQVDLMPPIQVAEIKKAVEGSDYKVKGKSKRTESSANNLPDPKVEKQDVITVDPALSFDKKKGKNVQSKNTKKTRLGKKGPKEQLADSLSEAEKDIGSRIICSKPCSIPGANEPSEVPSDIFACHTERSSHESDIRDDRHSSSHTDKGNEHMEVSKFIRDVKHSSGYTDKGNEYMEVPKFESAKISYIDNFGPGERQHEFAPGKELDIKDIQIEKSNKELPSIKKTKKNNVHSLGTSPALQESLNLNDNQGFQEKPQDSSFDVVKVQAPISKNQKGEAIANTHSRKISTTAGDRVKDLPSHLHEICDFTAHLASKTKIVDASGIGSPVHSSVVLVPFNAGDNAFVKGNSADWDASSSSSESPGIGVRKNIQSRGLNSRSKCNPVAAVKASSKKIGQVLNNSSHQKSLFATSGTIFKDSSSDSSEDEGEINNSGTSTKSPSDSSSSSSSDYLEGTNHSPQNALYVRKRKETGGDNLIFSQSGGPMDLSLDMILRSSRSYKKAKLTASQSQRGETESQPVDFVLDSLVDP
ncbi:hypothetical protein NE237_021124 [Protea cynaroides]|uniref:Uncharacterized protein n=1 Tax=Protea cynaroides TaxID=273540 RepID=A0A9Q0H8J1_9MAGN|nr:hypothetical protein NE237_021124 [Protea cynaroides]